jgi:hypothetical protein
MLPNEGTKKFVSHYLLDTSCLLCFFVVKSIFSDALYSSCLFCLLVVAVEVCLPHSDQGTSPGGGGFQLEQGGSVEAACHKERQIAKRDRNENRIKRRKAGERGDSSDEDLSPETSWSGDVPSAEVDWSNMSGSSLSSPPRATEVSSSRRPQTAAHDKNVGSNSR